ncbi:beta-glucan synthesis-associated protein-domain-containing protein [Mycena galopus ATCC 62051]|nr:beta-glucan synthesis-associated protein-domain-containing protein [Mycena galopus ATCC 62051]
MSYRSPRREATPELYPQQQYASVLPHSPPQSPQSRRSRSTRGAPSRVSNEPIMQQQYAQQYASVPVQSPPQSPQSQRSRRGTSSRAPTEEYASGQRSPTSPQSRRSRTRGAPSQAPTEEPVYASGSGRAGIIQGVATGSIGADYGPYSYDPELNRANPGEGTRLRKAPSAARPNLARTATVNTRFEKNLDLDDALHNPDPVADARMDRTCDIFSSRGWANATALFVLLGGLLMLFAGFPILDAFIRPKLSTLGASNLGGINGTGQVPVLTKFPKLIDDDTPSSASTYTGTDGKKYDLVFSDEFNVNGRSFYPGDDPYWEAVDLHYWPTGDLEWYDPGAVTTQGGHLVITMSEQNNHNLNFQSGMLASWNQMCFSSSAYVEVSISLPGVPSTPGFWPGAWMMGNLGRAGYGATTEGMWPYSYDACDVGTFPNQTDRNGQPTAVSDAKLSFLPGQRLSACTCPGSDHPGPSTSTGRGVPEIDILEAQVEIDGTAPYFRGQASQSYQIAPYNMNFDYDNSSSATPIANATNTKFNSYKGNQYQQTISAVTYIDDKYYSGNAFLTYGVEFFSNPSSRSSGYINWLTGGTKRWTLTADTIGPDPTSNVSQRLITEEPMYLVFNLGMSPNFQHQDFEHMQFPAQMLIDYVRVYQQHGTSNGLTCDPPERPTANYIADHIDAYSNANLTQWAQAGYTFPRNSLYDGCE